MTPTNEEIEALARRLDNGKIRFASENKTQATIRRNVAIDDAAVMLRQWIAERERLPSTVVELTKTVWDEAELRSIWTLPGFPSKTTKMRNVLEHMDFESHSTANIYRAMIEAGKL